MDAKDGDLLLTADWILPVASAPVRDGAVRVRGERIAWVGKRAEAERDRATVPPGRRIDLGRAAILPGLVNAHTHLELTVLRGYTEDLEFAPWIRRLTSAKYQKLDPAAYRASARWGALEAIRSGVSTVADGSDSGQVLDILIESGLRGIVYHEVFGPDERELPASMEGLKRALDAMAPRATERVRLGVSPHAPYTVSPALFRAVAGLALERGLPMMVHAAESRSERLLLRDGTGPFADALAARGIAWKAPGLSTIQYLVDLGVLRARPLLVHAVDVDLEDLQEIRRHGAAVAHCPKSNAKLASGIAPLGAFLEHGVKVGLGTDGAVSNNVCDLIEESRFAVLLQRATRAAEGGGPALEARAALRLMTLGGAEALGMDGDIGSLEPGKLADVAAVDLSGAHVAPVHDPEAAVVFAASGRDVVLTMVGGRILHRRGGAEQPDEEMLRRDLEIAARKLSPDPPA
jgi:5-methylthioadenosine/S-adenosylhomocysteine deaminase